VDWIFTNAIPLAWALVLLWGARYHFGVWRKVKHDVDVLEARADIGNPKLRTGVMALFRNDAATELDGWVVKLALSIPGILAVSPIDSPSWVTIAFLLGGVVWQRYRSVIRSRRREEVKS
jgi:hypothetical protein